ncbi:MAG: hypothetical protein JWR85_2338 [Marmoricola sp.]|nr:hypothetical protein [Marmoricola sp.]
MNIEEIRRYPVKSMAGESVESAAVDARGLTGDRWFAVVDGAGKLASGKNSHRFRRFDQIFDFSASMAEDQVRVVGPTGSWQIGDPELDRALTEHLGAEVHVQRETGTPFQDAGQVSLVGTASLDWCRQHLGVDGDRRRIRPNLVVRTTEPFVEEGWGGATLQVGGLRLTVVERIERCRMVDVAQEGLAEQPGWLKALGRERDLCLGMYADVVSGGSLTLGDPLDVVGVKHSSGD